MKLSKIFLLLILSCIIQISVLGLRVAVAAPCTAPTTILKLATLAPEGTSLYKGLLSAKTNIKAQTENCVDLQIYAGGQAGDEKDVVRKMRIGQLHMGAFTGVGLGMIEPEVRVLELPFLFSNETQVDSVYTQMRSYFNQKFDEKGFKLLGWAGVGFIQIFSNKPIQSKADLNGVKMWMWEGDPLAQAMYESLKVVPVPLAITDVLTSLQTGLIDGAYSPTLGAIAFQWHTKTKYVTKVDLVYGTGGLIIAKDAWAKLTPQYQQAVEQVLNQEATNLTQRTRRDNDESLQVLQTSGLTIVNLTPEARNELVGISKEVQTKLIGRLYPQALLDKVLGMIQ